MTGRDNSKGQCFGYFPEADLNGNAGLDDPPEPEPKPGLKRLRMDWEAFGSTAYGRRRMVRAFRSE